MYWSEYIYYYLYTVYIYIYRYMYIDLLKKKSIRKTYHVIDIWILHSYIPYIPLFFTKYDV